MKKIYKRSRAGLWVGLLSFHTLCSCVHPGRVLGIANDPNKEPNIEEARKRYEEVSKENKIVINQNASPLWYKGKCIFLRAGACLGLLGSALIGLPYYLPSRSNSIDNQSNILDMHNDSSVTTPVSLTSTAWNGTMVKNITKALEDGKKKWDTGQPNNDLIVDNPMFLSDLIIRDLQRHSFSQQQRHRLSKQEKHSFSKQRTQYWFDQGLNPNATNDKGASLLFFAVSRSKDYTEFLISKQADVNAQNIYNDTPLMIATQLHNEGIINALIENGADPCMKNDKGHTARYYAEKLPEDKRSRILAILNKAKQCVTR